MEKRKELNSQDKEEMCSERSESTKQTAEKVGFSVSENSRSLTERYKDLWRIRLRDNSYTKSISATLMFAVSAVLLNPIIGFSTLSGAILFLMGSLLGTAYSGYKYTMDDFTGFHMGVFSFIPLSIILFITVISTSPTLLVIIAPLLIFYSIVTGLSGVSYATLGRQVRDRD